MNVRKWKSMADRCGKESRYEGAPLQEEQSNSLTATHLFLFSSPLSSIAYFLLKVLTIMGKQSGMAMDTSFKPQDRTG